MLEPIAIALVGTWIAVVIVGHVLVFSAIYKCWREDRLEVQGRDPSTSDDRRQRGEVAVHG
jgi:hypothetical protein